MSLPPAAIQGAAAMQLGGTAPGCIRARRWASEDYLAQGASSSRRALLTALSSVLVPRHPVPVAAPPALVASAARPPGRCSSRPCRRLESAGRGWRRGGGRPRGTGGMGSDDPSPLTRPQPRCTEASAPRRGLCSHAGNLRVIERGQRLPRDSAAALSSPIRVVGPL